MRGALARADPKKRAASAKARASPSATPASNRIAASSSGRRSRIATASAVRAAIEQADRVVQRPPRILRNPRARLFVVRQRLAPLLPLEVDLAEMHVRDLVVWRVLQHLFEMTLRVVQPAGLELVDREILARRDESADRWRAPRESARSPRRGGRRR